MFNILNNKNMSNNNMNIIDNNFNNNKANNKANLFPDKNSEAKKLVKRYIYMNV